MANNAITLKAQDRTEFGKGSARQARRAGQVPVVVYGHGTEPRHLLLEEHATRLALRSNDNALVELDIAGGETLLALAKDVQRHPIRPGVQHVDFLLVDRNERVDVEVPVTVIGEAAPGTIHMIEAATIMVSAPAVSVPEAIEVDITGVAAGTVITVADQQSLIKTLLTASGEADSLGFRVKFADFAGGPGHVGPVIAFHEDHRMGQFQSHAGAFGLGGDQFRIGHVGEGGFHGSFRLSGFHRCGGRGRGGIGTSGWDEGKRHHHDPSQKGQSVHHRPVDIAGCRTRIMPAHWLLRRQETLRRRAASASQATPVPLGQFLVRKRNGNVSARSRNINACYSYGAR